MTASEPTIRVNGVWKRYGLPLAHWLASFRGVPMDDPRFWALREISFEVQPGETIGIIGRNGAGKSTLLKVLSGVTPPTRGQVHITGRTFPMIELNAGIHQELTGRENVRFLGTMMGLSGKEMRSRLPEIEDFAELGEWFDRPVRQYSSGMQTRLGFAVAMNVSADVLLIDEVLAVGDMSFQRKCFERMGEMRGKATVVFVSHSMLMVERICDRAVYMDAGQVVACGDTTDIINTYSRRNMKKTKKHPDTNKADASATTDAPATSSTEPVEITHIELLQEDGSPASPPITDAPLTIRIHYVAHRRILGGHCTISISNDQLIQITRFNNNGYERPHLEGSGFFDCHLKKLNWMEGVYQVSAAIYNNMFYPSSKPYTTELFEVHTPITLKSKSCGLVWTDSEWD